MQITQQHTSRFMIQATEHARGVLQADACLVPLRQVSLINPADDEVNFFPYLTLRNSTGHVKLAKQPAFYTAPGRAVHVDSLLPLVDR